MEPVKVQCLIFFVFWNCHCSLYFNLCFLPQLVCFFSLLMEPVKVQCLIFFVFWNCHCSLSFHLCFLPQLVCFSSLLYGTGQGSMSDLLCFLKLPLFFVFSSLFSTTVSLLFFFTLWNRSRFNVWSSLFSETAIVLCLFIFVFYHS